MSKFLAVSAASALLMAVALPGSADATQVGVQNADQYEFSSQQEEMKKGAAVRRDSQSGSKVQSSRAVSQKQAVRTQRQATQKRIVRAKRPMAKQRLVRTQRPMAQQRFVRTSRAMAQERVIHRRVVRSGPRAVQRRVVQRRIVRTSPRIATRRVIAPAAAAYPAGYSIYGHSYRYPYGHGYSYPGYAFNPWWGIGAPIAAAATLPFLPFMALGAAANALAAPAVAAAPAPAYAAQPVLSVRY